MLNDSMTTFLSITALLCAKDSMHSCFCILEINFNHLMVR